MPQALPFSALRNAWGIATAMGCAPWADVLAKTGTTTRAAAAATATTHSVSWTSTPLTPSTVTTVP